MAINNENSAVYVEQFGDRTEGKQQTAATPFFDCVQTCYFDFSIGDVNQIV